MRLIDHLFTVRPGDLVKHFNERGCNICVQTVHNWKKRLRSEPGWVPQKRYIFLLLDYFGDIDELNGLKEEREDSLSRMERIIRMNTPEEAAKKLFNLKII